MLNSQNHQNEEKPPMKLVSEWFVKPKHEVEAAKQPYHLGPVELGMLSIDPIQKGLLYTLHLNPPSSSSSDQTNGGDRSKILSHLLEKLRHSLSLALVHYYPLAGRMSTEKCPENHACSIFVDCTKGPGARLVHASALDFTVSDILSPTYVPPIVRSLFDFGEKTVNYDGHTRALLSLQVTELLDGVFMGFTMNHSVVDGTTFTRFVSVLSEIFRSEPDPDDENIRISKVPVFNYKPWVDDVTDHEQAQLPRVLKLPYPEPEEFIVRGFEPGPLKQRIFHFSPTSMAELKAKANQECGTHNVISSFQSLAGLVWRSITQARNLPSGSAQRTAFNFIINARNRLHPPLSDDYFGNLIGGAQWVCDVDELLGHGLGWAAMNLREAILAQDDKAIRGVYKLFAKTPFVVQRGVENSIHGPNRVVVGGSARFDLYGPEFGLGRAVAARVGYGNNEDGKVTANPGCEEGSVDLEICVRPETMKALEADHEFMRFVSL